MNYNKKIDIHLKKDFITSRKFPSYKLDKNKKEDDLRKTISMSETNKNVFKDLNDSREGLNNYKKHLELSKVSENVLKSKKDEKEENGKDDILWEKEVLIQKERDKIFKAAERKSENRFKEVKDKIYYHSNVLNTANEDDKVLSNSTRFYNNDDNTLNSYRKDYTLHPYRKRDWGHKIDVLPGAIKEKDLYSFRNLNKSVDTFHTGKNIKMQAMRFKYLESTFQNDPNIKKVAIPETHPSWRNLNDYKLEDCNIVHKFVPAKQKMDLYRNSLGIKDY